MQCLELHENVACYDPLQRPVISLLELIYFGVSVKKLTHESNRINKSTESEKLINILRSFIRLPKFFSNVKFGRSA
jgi:hypothetical protein